MRDARGGNRVRHVHPHTRDPMTGAMVMLVAAWAAAAVDSDSITGPVIAIFLVLGAAVVIAQKFGWLPSGSVAKAAQERAELSQRELDVAIQENNLLRAQVRDLEQRTNLQPLLDGQGRTAEAIKEMADALRDQSTAIRELARRNTGH
jgi:hypothetical protein